LAPPIHLHGVNSPSVRYSLWLRRSRCFPSIRASMIVGGTKLIPLAEVFNEIAANVAVDGRRRALHVAALLDVLAEECPERRRAAGLLSAWRHQPNRGQFAVQLVGNLRQPARRIGIDGDLMGLRLDDLFDVALDGFGDSPRDGAEVDRSPARVVGRAEDDSTNAVYVCGNARHNDPFSFEVTQSNFVVRRKEE